MSLLLDALKKAALEKQRRENPNDVKEPAFTSPQLPAEPIAQEEELDFNLEEIEVAQELIVERPAAEKMQVESAPIESVSAESVRVEPTRVEPARVEPVAPVEFTQKKEVEKAVAEKVIEPSPAPFVPPLTQPTSPANLKISAQDSSVEIRKIVQEFDASSGKQALLQLLGRSKKAASQARKRMIIMSAVLIVTSVTLVSGYFFLLRGSSVALVASTENAPSSPSPQILPATESSSELETDTQILGASPAVVSNQQVAQLIDEFENETETISEGIHSVKTEKKYERANRQQKVDVLPKKISPTNMLPTNDDMNRSESLPEDKQVKIISHQLPLNDPISEAIQRGYQAYQQGDLNVAGVAYREALEQDANNRDALLGAAAVAVREGRQQDALSYYQRRLARAPKDDYAQAGVVALSATHEASPELDAELSRLLREYPEASHLHFLKGSLFAVRQQWAAAQLAFFEAWQRDNKNPELAFNLAVALDHLNQPKEAARFYQQAISLGDSRRVNFSVDDVQRRLNAIEVKAP
jgi:tetratricopeptide (TPR) repeat protein